MDLVTGGAGFVGSFLAKRLLESGRDVRVFDLETSDFVPEGAEFFRGDMRDYDAVRSSLSGVDTVYHLAFVQAFSKRDERETWAVNYGGTENFLKAAVDEGVGRFVHTSTVEVYSPDPPVPVTEESPTDRPFGWYGRHKKECETLCWRYYGKYRIPLTMLRLPTICGRGYYARIDLLRVFDWILANRPLLWVGGRQYKGDFIWVEDCVDAYLLLGTKDEAVGEEFNISCSETNTSLEVIEALQKAAGNTWKLRFVPPWIAWPVVEFAARVGILDMPVEQVQFLTADWTFSIEKARRLLGYSPKKTSAEAATELILGYMEDKERAKAKALNY